MAMNKIIKHDIGNILIFNNFDTNSSKRLFGQYQNLTMKQLADVGYDDEGRGSRLGP